MLLRILTGVRPINDQTIVLNYEYMEKASDPLKTVNIAVAAYVTAQARHKLYSYSFAKRRFLPDGSSEQLGYMKPGTE